MIYKYLSFSVSITIISFIIGMTINAFLKNTEFYKNKLSNLNFVENKNLNKWIGVSVVKWIIKNTPLKYLNQKIKLSNKIEKSGLLQVRSEMTSAEIDHLIGFAFVSLFALAKFYKTELLFGLTIMMVNTLMNLHPSLLQQQNKRRIDKLIKKL